MSHLGLSFMQDEDKGPVSFSYMLISSFSNINIFNLMYFYYIVFWVFFSHLKLVFLILKITYSCINILF